MPDERPLLTIAIPTYNRSKYLALLLESLIPQLANDGKIELIVLDNASEDETSEIVKSLLANRPGTSYKRNDKNIGADANFLRCFERACGRYVWLIGDDDLILPGGISAVLRVLEEHSPNLVFVAPAPFRYDATEIRGQAAAVPTQVVRNAKRMIRLANLHADLILISSLIVDKDQICSRPHVPFVSLVGTNLVQLGWTLTSLQNFQRGVFVGLGVLATKVGNSGGFNAANVFGENYRRAIFDILGSDSQLTSSLLDDHFRIWFPRNWHQFRNGEVATSCQLLQNAFRKNIKYWIFAYPVIRGPRWLSFVWAKLLLMRVKVLISLLSEPVR